MLLQFRFSNYRSFKEEQVFSLLATSKVSKDRIVDEENIHRNGKLRILKTSAIYGANASGKSNVVKSISIMREMVINSARAGQYEDELPYEPFLLNTSTKTQPSAFEIIFKQENIKYRYGFNFNKDGIINEWLFRTKVNEVMVFERENNSITLGRSLQDAQPIVRFTRNNALFISILAQFNLEVGQKVVDWFWNIEYISPEMRQNDRRKVMKVLREEPKIAEATANFLKILDIGISDLQIDKEKSQSEDYPLFSFTSSNRTANENAVRTLHKVYDNEGKEIGFENFDLDKHESDGTRKLFYMVWPILSALSIGRVVLVDEVDARLHPAITETIIRLFASRDVNKRCGQLIFTTHDTNLLKSSLFRRDQIWFVEKSTKGESQLYSLSDYEPRNDRNYEKDYLSGRYGAIPFINSDKFIEEFNGL